MSVLFGRNVFLDIGTSAGAARRFSDLRINFSIKMSSTSTPNEARIKVYNPAPDTVSTAQEEGAIVRLYVGYQVPLLVFQGNPISGGVAMSRTGPDRILAIQAQDGGEAYQDTAINLTYATATSLRQAFDAAAEALGLPIGSAEFTDIPEAFPLGINLTGPVRHTLDNLAEIGGFSWTIRDGALYAIPTGETSGESAVLFSSATGNLIGAPEPKDEGKISITGLLAPTLRPGKPFRLASEFYSGDYIAEDVEITGDSGFDTPFYVKAVGTPL